MPRRYVIVGSGVAGVSAAEVIRREDPLGHLTSSAMTQMAITRALGLPIS